MRIAVSGTHYTGKTSLVEDLGAKLPGHATVPEPYVLLEDEGHDFPEEPTLEDFEAQLERSLRAFQENKGAAIFDRSPIDLLAYAASVPDSNHFALGEWLPEVVAAVETLDLIVYLSAENNDRIPIPKSEDNDYRYEVDERIRKFLLENSLNLAVEVIEVAGSPEKRVARVLDWVARAH